MGKRCPPGVICVENMTVVLIGFFMCVVVYLYKQYESKKQTSRVGNSMQYENIKLMPININTQPRMNTSYNQIGVLSRTKNDDVIMPLYGRHVMSGRDAWQYYTITEHNVRLPLSVGGRSSTSEQGCTELFNGDNVYVQGYNDAFMVTVYDDINKPQYIPYV